MTHLSDSKRGCFALAASYQRMTIPPSWVLSSNCFLRCFKEAGERVRDGAGRARKGDRNRWDEEDDEPVLDEPAGLRGAVGERKRNRDGVIPAKWQGGAAKRVCER